MAKPLCILLLLGAVCREAFQIVIKDATAIGWRYCGNATDLDLAIITDHGVYIYDKLEDIKEGRSCRGPEEMSEIFTGYPDIPSASDVDAAVLYNFYSLEVYSGNKVWAWYAGSKFMQPIPGYPKLLNRLYGNEAPGHLNWAASRSRWDEEKHLCNSDGMISMYVRDEYRRSFRQDDIAENIGGFDENPWHGLPADTTAVMTASNYRDYVVLTSDKHLYYYSLLYFQDSFDPPAKATYHGVVKFK